MSEPYEEIIAGEQFVRQAPGARHEMIRQRLEARLALALTGSSVADIRPARSVVSLTPGTLIRPDLAVVTRANERLLLAVEVIDPHDHRLDTVDKKELYEQRNVPRLWMVDPRYDNVEVYLGSPFGLRLQGIFAGRDRLTDVLLPGFEFVIRELFAES